MRIHRWINSKTKKDGITRRLIRDKLIKDKMGENYLRWFGHKLKIKKCNNERKWNFQTSKIKLYPQKAVGLKIEDSGT